MKIVLVLSLFQPTTRTTRSIDGKNGRIKANLESSRSMRGKETEKRHEEINEAMVKTEYMERADVSSEKPHPLYQETPPSLCLRKVACAIMSASKYHVK